jgi:predicted nucleic acid-binding Zn ribbon protein
MKIGLFDTNRLSLFTMERNCKQCGKTLHGRTDKKFCSLACKNAYNVSQRKATRTEVREVDACLHRNWEILATLMGDSKKEMFDRAILSRARFKWEFMTGIYFNKVGKMYRIIYDYAWMDFSDQQVLVVRKTKTG